VCFVHACYGVRHVLPAKLGGKNVPGTVAGVSGAHSGEAVLGGEGVDLAREDEVVDGQAADGVRREGELDVLVAGDVDVGVVTLFLGEHANAVRERQRLAKVRQDEAPP